MPRHLLHHVYPYVVLASAFFANAGLSDIRINEVMSSNGSTLPGLDGEFDDWIELFNSGSTPVDLAGWGLSDDPSTPFRWLFPDETWLAPGAFLIVRASGRDTTSVNAPETWIPAGALWRYDDSGADHGAAFSDPAFDDSTWPTGLAPLGYAVPERANYVTTTIGFGGDPQNKHITTWFRKNFAVNNPTVAQGVELRLWLDDGAVVYINGIEVVRENMPEGPVTAQTTTPTYVGVWPSWNSYAVPSHLFLPGANAIAVRLHQHHPTSSDLAFDLELEAIVKQTELHAGFSLSRDGEPLRLTRPNGSTADAIDLPPIPRDVSYGRPHDEPALWRFFAEATPGAPNTTIAYESVLAPPIFSLPPGIYPNAIAVDASHAEPDVVIRYTTDGRKPTPDDPVWTGPINLTPASWTPGPLALIRTNPIEVNLHRNYGWELPIGDVPKARLLRLRAWKPGHLPSEDIGGTWWVGADFTGRHNLDLVSLQVEPDDFFDHERGIYVPGKIYEDGGFGNDWWGRPHANYFQVGPDWERPAFFEFFANGQPAVAGPLFTRIHGAGSRAQPQKSLRLYDRGGGALAYPFFPGPRGREDNSFSRLILRNSGQDWHDFGPTMMRDGYLQQLIWHMDLDLQAYRPTVLYLNGEFWGIHNIRERLDTHYLERRYGVARDAVDLLNNDAIVKAGDNLDYLDLRAFIHQQSMADPANYAAAAERIDLSNFIDYYVANIFLANTDWPGNNIDYWRERRPLDPTAPKGRDGRWRWIVFDLDFCAQPENTTRDMFTWLKVPTSGWPRPAWSQRMIRGLWDSPEFVAEFCTRFADHLNTTFLPSRAYAMIDEMADAIEEDIVPHFRRWGRTTTLSNWRSNVQRMRTFALNRPANVWSHLQDHFPTGGTRDIVIRQLQPEAGTVRVNSLIIDGARTPGIPAGRPAFWTGRWFAAWPIEIEALPEPDWVFSHWLETGETDPLLSVVPAHNQEFTPVFAPAPYSIAAHYWAFNDPESPLTPTYTLGGGSLAIEPGPETVVTQDSGQDFDGANNRHTELTGAHLRLQNPIGATLTFSLPTPGIAPHTLTYEARRSTRGAALITLSNTLDGVTWELLDTFVPPAAPPDLHVIDLTAIEGAQDNPVFAVKFEISQGIGDVEGNVRIDNVALDAWALPGTVLPPEPIAIPEPVVWMAGDPPHHLDVAQWFVWPTNMPPSLSLVTSVPDLADATDLGDGLLAVTPLRHGGGQFTIIASTPGQTHGGPTTLSVPILIHPQPVELAAGRLSFFEWSPNATAGAMPDHLLFVQGEQNDATLDTPLPFAYHVPSTDMAAADLDAGLLGFPYRLTARTRMTGLGADGVSFINTGRGRDLGAAIATLDTRGIPAAEVLWTGGTVTPNSRHYAIRLQYRIDPDAPWLDVLDGDDSPVEYSRHPMAGHETNIGPHDLPPAALGQPRAQLRWVYHHVSGTSGPRDELRLDDIIVRIPPDTATSYAQWRATHFDAGDPAGEPQNVGETGEANLILYALGLAPDQPASRIIHIAPDATFCWLQYNPNRPDLRWILRASYDLQGWPLVPFDSATDPPPPVDALHRAVIPLPVGEHDLFLGLEIELINP